MKAGVVAWLSPPLAILPTTGGFAVLLGAVLLRAVLFATVLLVRVLGALLSPVFQVRFAGERGAFAAAGSL